MSSGQDHFPTHSQKEFGLIWPGKDRAKHLAYLPAKGILQPIRDDSIPPDTTQNIIIEGDNFDVLKLLKKDFEKKIKLIYIDPPYNTGNDFVYLDNFQSHADWLNMIYPRLLLAKDLLKDDGVIFISIDDNECHNLSSICREIFGDENYCGTFVWEKKKKTSFLNNNMGCVTEYILAFAKNREKSPSFVVGLTENGKKYPFNNAGNSPQTLVFPAGSVTFTCSDQIVKAQDMSKGNIKTALLDDVHIQDGKNLNEFRLYGEWRYSQKKLEEFVANGDQIVISKIPFRPNYINCLDKPKKTTNLLSFRLNGVPTNEDATNELRELFGADVINYPKPTGLIKYLIQLVTKEDDIILDFFAGSGTTGHAVWLANIEQKYNRKFILVQCGDSTTKKKKDGSWKITPAGELGLKTVFDVLKERLKRTRSKIKQDHPSYVGDLGFSTFKFIDG